MAGSLCCEVTAPLPLLKSRVRSAGHKSLSPLEMGELPAVRATEPPGHAGFPLSCLGLPPQVTSSPVLRHRPQEKRLVSVCLRAASRTGEPCLRGQGAPATSTASGRGAGQLWLPPMPPPVTVQTARVPPRPPPVMLRHQHTLAELPACQPQ